jgi:hypothetical protein
LNLIRNPKDLCPCLSQLCGDDVGTLLLRNTQYDRKPGKPAFHLGCCWIEEL